jgi:zinc protease
MTPFAAFWLSKSFLSHFDPGEPLPGVNTLTVSENESTDAALVRTSLAGDTNAFGVLVRRHQNLVAGIAYSVLGRRSTAEDVAQEAFVAAWRQLATLQDPSRVRAWLAGITRNLALNRLRAQERDAIAPAASTAEDGATTAPSPDTEAMLREEEALVDHTLAHLPEEYREVLILYYREEHSTAAVADALALSEEAVRQRLVRGRRLLQERVLHQVERTLRRTGPGATFAIAVLALLPAPPAAAASASAGIGAIPVVSSVVLGVAGLSTGARLGLLGAVLGCLCGALGGYLGARQAFSQVRTNAQRSILVTATWEICLLALAYVGAMLVCTLNFRALAAIHPALGVGSVLVLSACYVAVIFIFTARLNARFRQGGPSHSSRL